MEVDADDEIRLPHSAGSIAGDPRRSCTTGPQGRGSGTRSSGAANRCTRRFHREAPAGDRALVPDAVRPSGPVRRQRASAGGRLPPLLPWQQVLVTTRQMVGTVVAVAPRPSTLGASVSGCSRLSACLKAFAMRACVLVERHSAGALQIGVRPASGEDEHEFRVSSGHVSKQMPPTVRHVLDVAGYDSRWRPDGRVMPPAGWGGSSAFSLT